MEKNEILEAVKHFQLEGTLLETSSYGNGHINDTYLVRQAGSGGEKKYILQKMNRTIFKNPLELVENIANVTGYLKNIIIQKGGEPERETLNLIPSKTGESCYVDERGEFWRMYLYIEDAFSPEQVESPQDFYESGFAFGHFQQLLADFPAETLHVTIADFHNTARRLENLKAAIREDSHKRACEVEQEIKFALEREGEVSALDRLLEEGELPLRVTHNDTKLNNVMLDRKTRKGICVIDLDTVMPGLSAHDFGDAIRYGANTGAEDTRDLAQVSCSLELFEIYARGFLEGCNNSLTQKEVEMLPMGAKIMTLECGMRFLTDYLQGDIYFKTHREKQNLDRCRTQFKLVQDMEHKWEEMKCIIKRQSDALKTS